MHTPSSEELARPVVSDPAPGMDDCGESKSQLAALRRDISDQDVRTADVAWQHAEVDAELAALRRQRSDQEARAADLERQHAQARIDLIRRRDQLAKWKKRAVRLERLIDGTFSSSGRRGWFLAHRVASGLILLGWSVKSLSKSVLKVVAVPLLRGRAFQGRGQRKLTFNLVRELEELRERTQDEIAETESLLRYLEHERGEQSSRVEHLTRLIAEQERFEGQPLVRLARSYRRDPWWPELQSLRSISMLHFETLYLLRSLAMRTTDAVVEVGPYIGGSTIALGRGLQMGGGGPLISIEMGGSYPNHAVPTNDIIADLKRNVEAHGLTGLAHIMEGFSTDPAIDAAVDRILAGKPIGLLFLDADGDVARDFELYRSRLSRGSILIFDDFISEHAPEKQTTIKIWVDQAVASGLVENLGVYRWGTWVGRYWG